MSEFKFIQKTYEKCSVYRKIEMITSFGNDESESEESEHEEPPKITPILKKPSTKSSKISHSSSKSSNSDISKTKIGPTLPATQFGPQNQEKLSEKLSQVRYLFYNIK